MIDYLVRNNHQYEHILDVYPISFVKNLFKAGRDNDKTEHLQQVTGMAMAVIHAIDVTFGSGKGKVLQEYAKALQQEGKKKPDKPKDGVQVNRNFLAFMNSLPKKGPVNEPS